MRDAAVFDLVDRELQRQREGLELIASENFTSAAVMEAQGSVLTNKYAEGYPSKRYYGGCEVVDEVEVLAIERLKSLYGAEAANVQPHSGSQANAAAYMALIQPGDTFLAMDLNAGGHLTHGASFNFSGKLYRPVHYGLIRESERIDYDQAEQLARQHQPKLIVVGASAYPRIIDFARFRAIADQVGAKLMVDMAHIAGLVAGGVHPSPVPFADIVTSTTHKTLRGPRSGMILCKEAHLKAVNSAVFPGQQGGPLMHVVAAKAVAFGEALQPSFKSYAANVVKNAQALAAALVEQGFRIVSGGTDNHIVLVDVKSQGFTGKEAESMLGACAMTVNKNQIPFDSEKPTVSSGIRLGTPALTTRGFGENEMKQIAALFARALFARGDAAKTQSVRDEVEALASRFPLYAAAGTGRVAA